METGSKKGWTYYANIVGLLFSFVAIVVSVLSYRDSSKSLEMAEKVHSDRYAGVEVNIDMFRDYETRLYTLPNYGDRHFIDLEFHCIAINNADRGTVVKDVRIEVSHGKGDNPAFKQPLGTYLPNGEELVAASIPPREPLPFTTKIRVVVSDEIAKRIKHINKSKAGFNIVDMKQNLSLLAIKLGEYTKSKKGVGYSVNPESSRLLDGSYRIRLITNDGEYTSRWITYF